MMISDCSVYIDAQNFVYIQDTDSLHSRYRLFKLSLKRFCFLISQFSSGCIIHMWMTSVRHILSVQEAVRITSPFLVLKEKVF